MRRCLELKAAYAQEGRVPRVEEKRHAVVGDQLERLVNALDDRGGGRLVGGRQGSGATDLCGTRAGKQLSI